LAKARLAGVFSTNNWMASSLSRMGRVVSASFFDCAIPRFASSSA